MAIRSDLMRPPVFVAQPLAEHKNAKTETRIIDFRSGIANSVRKP